MYYFLNCRSEYEGKNITLMSQLHISGLGNFPLNFSTSSGH